MKAPNEELEHAIAAAVREVRGQHTIVRVALDTNVLVSLALVSGGRLEPIWRAWKASGFEVLSCDEFQREIKQVLARPKLARTLDLDARRHSHRLPADFIAALEGT